METATGTINEMELSSLTDRKRPPMSLREAKSRFRLGVRES